MLPVKFRPKAVPLSEIWPVVDCALLTISALQGDDRKTEPLALACVTTPFAAVLMVMGKLACPMSPPAVKAMLAASTAWALVPRSSKMPKAELKAAVPLATTCDMRRLPLLALR